MDWSKSLQVTDTQQQLQQAPQSSALGPLQAGPWAGASFSKELSLPLGAL